MGALVPVLFLAIAILTMVTTMHRITANEKTQIGTLKALGFKDRRILRHYTSYGFMLGLAGTILGILLGYFIAGFIMDENGMMGTYIDMPSWQLRMPQDENIIKKLSAPMGNRLLPVTHPVPFQRKRRGILVQALCRSLLCLCIYSIPPHCEDYMIESKSFSGS